MPVLIIDSPTHGTKELLFDEEDSSLVYSYTWYIFKNQADNFYAKSWTPSINKKRTRITLHTLLTGFNFVDHINGNGLDNRRINLRKSNHRTNAMNRKKLRKNKESIYKGVFIQKQTNKGGWLSRIVVNGKQKYLGTFVLEKDAAIAYNEAAINILANLLR